MTQIGTLGLVFANMDGVGTNYLYVMEWVFACFGRSASTLRLLPSLFGVLAIVTNYSFYTSFVRPDARPLSWRCC
jgi:uncharacterized membrane protein